MIRRLDEVLFNHLWAIHCVLNWRSLWTKFTGNFPTVFFVVFSQFLLDSVQIFLGWSFVSEWIRKCENYDSRKKFTKDVFFFFWKDSFTVFSVFGIVLYELLSILFYIFILVLFLLSRRSIILKYIDRKLNKKSLNIASNLLSFRRINLGHIQRECHSVFRSLIFMYSFLKNVL